ncbi:MAG: CesT family type III secretion system chaperone [Opitutales bacterium]|nr:CesT family type III secretion system chaperone [Opitutales bacterium]
MLIDLELKAFGESLGLPHLQFNEQGCLKFLLEQNRAIYMEKVSDWIFFYILKTYDLSPLPYSLYEKALSMLLHHPHAQFSVQAVAKSDHDLGFFTKIHDSACDQPTLYRLWKYLLLCSEYLDSLA